MCHRLPKALGRGSSLGVGKQVAGQRGIPGTNRGPRGDGRTCCQPRAVGGHQQRTPCTEGGQNRPDAPLHKGQRRAGGQGRIRFQLISGGHAGYLGEFFPVGLEQVRCRVVQQGTQEGRAGGINGQPRGGGFKPCAQGMGNYGVVVRRNSWRQGACQDQPACRVRSFRAAARVDCQGQQALLDRSAQFRPGKVDLRCGAVCLGEGEVCPQRGPDGQVAVGYARGSQCLHHGVGIVSRKHCHCGKTGRCKRPADVHALAPGLFVNPCGPLNGAADQDS